MVSLESRKLEVYSSDWILNDLLLILNALHDIRRKYLDLVGSL